MAADVFGWNLTKRFADRWAQYMAQRDEAVGEDVVAQNAIAAAPTVWLLGKVQSGKSSIVRAITGREDAEIGSGFRPCTKTAEIFDFPAEAPLIRFLDTRGLGEARYDPSEDLEMARDKAQLIIVTMRALDQQQDQLIDVLQAVRREHPDWPIVVAQTCLHDGYAHGQGHIEPYPFSVSADNGDLIEAGVPEDLVRSMERQRGLFDEVPGRGPIRFVPIDFTQDGDGFEPRNYGLDALMAALVEAAPEGLAVTLQDLRNASASSLSQRVRPTILGYAGAAAACDVVPVAGAIAVPGVQAKLLHSLANAYGVEWDRRMLGEFAGCLGAGVVARLAATFGIRQLAKLIPVYGQTAGAAMAAATSFATTYALGTAGCYFLAKRKLGESDPKGVARTYREALEAAFAIAREKGFGTGAKSGEDDRSGRSASEGTGHAPQQS